LELRAAEIGWWDGVSPRQKARTELDGHDTS
jgi:hypothetical protein